jgi:SAM-dependent methyltransferase
VAHADRSGLESSSADVVTVAQALHWLDRDAFFSEARRVLGPGGVIAVWCYSLLEIDDRVDALVRSFYEETVGPYWLQDRRLVDVGYRDLDFPFDEFELPPLTIERDLTLDQLGAYLRTWSATQRYVQDRGDDPVAPLIAELARLWGDPTAVRPARWPLAVRAGYRDTRER